MLTTQTSAVALDLLENHLRKNLRTADTAVLRQVRIHSIRFRIQPKQCRSKPLGQPGKYRTANTELRGANANSSAITNFVNGVATIIDAAYRFRRAPARRRPDGSNQHPRGQPAVRGEAGRSR